jgi:hypothetical protein
MPTCIFAAHAGPSGMKLGGVTKANFLAGASVTPTADPILKGNRPVYQRALRTRAELGRAHRF